MKKIRKITKQETNLIELEKKIADLLAEKESSDYIITKLNTRIVELFDENKSLNSKLIDVNGKINGYFNSEIALKREINVLNVDLEKAKEKVIYAQHAQEKERQECYDIKQDLLAVKRCFSVLFK